MSNEEVGSRLARKVGSCTPVLMEDVPQVPGRREPRGVSACGLIPCDGHTLGKGCTGAVGTSCLEPDRRIGELWIAEANHFL